MKKTFKRLLSGLLCLAMLLCVLPAASVHAETGYDRGYNGSMAGDGKLYAHGLDVSAWQESGLNFQNFANAGYTFVILRIGTSYGKDTCFEEYYASAKAAGLNVGCYYYSYATSVAQAQQEARDVISWIGKKVFEYPVYYDYEDPSQSSISGTTAGQICHGFMDKLRDAGFLVGLYSMSSWLERDWVTTSGLRGEYEGWVASLPSEENNSGITSNLYTVFQDRFWKRYGLYQYSFTTWVNGEGPFDCNVAYKDYPDIVKTFGFNNYQPEESWVEKAAFDPMVYRDRYPDLAGKTDEQLKNHWLKYGIKEGRCASAVLDLTYYRDNNPDLKAAFGDDFTALYNHFITKGYKEQRKFSRLFDGAYYVKKYPEVVTSFKENFLLHYVKYGIKENRRASETFDVRYYWFIRPDVAEAWPEDYEMAARHYAGHGVREGIVAYDKEKPVISDAVISNVTSQGYTVTCKVTDNWGVSKVAFPTWTVYNDQDDLAEDFMNTQKGTKNGDTWTFRVYTSVHGYETGWYATHIYAVDKGGNTVSLALDTVEVKDPEPTLIQQQIKLNTDNEYLKLGNLIKNVPEDTFVGDLLCCFENEGLVVLDRAGNPMADSAIVGTGVTVNLYSGGELVDYAAVVIRGDLDGSGHVDTNDYMRMKASVMGDILLSPAETAAADVDYSDSVNSTDYMQLKAHFLGQYSLYD